jgi:hypothetical protein
VNRKREIDRHVAAEQQNKNCHHQVHKSFWYLLRTTSSFASSFPSWPTIIGTNL